MVEKLVKEFEKIRASLSKSKKLIVADIDKIDEKYRRLAQEEKKSLTESLAVLNEQLKYYDKMLANEPNVEEVDEKSEYIEPDPDNEAPELTIQDTIFPENNEPESKSEPEPVKEEKVEEVVEEKTEPVAELEKKEETAVEDIPEITDTNWDDVQNAKTDENGWPVW